MHSTPAYNTSSLPLSASFRFRLGNIRFPESLDEAAAASGFAAGTVALQPSFTFPLSDLRSAVSVHLDDDDAPLPAGWREAPVRGALTAAVSADPSFAPEPLFRAYHLSQWRAESVFCGRCGERNGDAPDELARLCPSCGRREYPRISPAVIVLVTRGDGAALLAHNSKFRQGLYSLVAGFVEAGESLEATVAREVREEVGVEVGSIRYRASQPWPFPNSLMLAFTAEWVSGEPRPDGVEIADVQWFTPETIPEIPPRGSVSRTLIDLWLDGRYRGKED